MEALGKIADGIGQPVRRKEDFRLLTGKGSFADDIQLPGLVHAVIVRSPHAHAHIRSINKAAALASPGVLAVLTGSDYIADGLHLRRLRHEKGLSQDDLAYEAEVSRSYLSQLEKGAFYASLKIIGKLAEALGVEPAELLKRVPAERKRE
jgi:CO/xanthine dehydrogenase Mo-binding subunit